MSLIVKIMSAENIPDDDPRKGYSLYPDVTGVHFFRQDGSDMAGEGAMVRLYVREPIKTAMVPGFCENEKVAHVTGNVYVMNENGKTISSFGAAPYPYELAGRIATAPPVD